MHMWMWFGYDLGEFMFSGLEISTRWAFALTWIVLFFTALLFEASKVYLAKVQRDAHLKFYPYRSDERRNLLCSDRHCPTKFLKSRIVDEQKFKDKSTQAGNPPKRHRTTQVDYGQYRCHRRCGCDFDVWRATLQHGDTWPTDRCITPEQGGNMEPTTSRNASSGQVSRWASLKVRMLVNSHQSLVFLLHNVVGYLLMLAVMVYNVHLLLAVVFGMMLGYFLFGPKLTRLQMQCLGSQRTVICTPECDDTAETTPPLLDSTSNSETDIFICRTRTCVQPSHYYVASTSGEGSSDSATCSYGAKRCPSMVAKAKKLKTCSHNSTSEIHIESEKEDTPSVEAVQLLRTERQGCCKKENKETSPEKKDTCCKMKQSKKEDMPSVEAVQLLRTERQGCCKKENKETSPEKKDTCCKMKQSEKEDIPSVEAVQLLRTERQGCCKKESKETSPEKKDTCCKMKQSEKEDTPSVEAVQLLRTERQGCCKKESKETSPEKKDTCCKMKQDPPPEKKEGCCKKSQREENREEANREEEESPCLEEEKDKIREESPQISCCHTKATPTESREQIV